MNANFFFKCLLLCVAMLSLLGCGSSSETAPSGTGSVLARFFWTTDGNSTQAKASQKASADVYAVRIIVSGAGMADVQRDFPSIYDSYSFDGIAEGSDRTVKAQGLDLNGIVIYQGIVSNIRIDGGQVTDVGYIVMQSPNQSPSTALKIMVGSSVNDVIYIQGAPPSIRVESDATVFVYASGDAIRISNTTSKVVSWENTSGSLQVSMVPGNNTTGAVKATIGSTLDDVITIQGVPKSIQVGLDVTVYSYGSGDTIGISNTTGTVVSWNNTGGTLQVTMAPGSNTTGATSITIGSTLDDIIAIQGTPRSIQTGTGSTTLTYGSTDIITVANATKLVISWNNSGGSLRVAMVPGSSTSGAAKITLGSTLDDVIAIQGTPRLIQVYSDATMFTYDSNDTISVSNTTHKVVSWSNTGKTLQVLLTPGSNTTGITNISLGSTLDDVILIQGTPLSIQVISSSTVFTYDTGDSISVANATKKVVSWNNTGGSLRIAMVPGNGTTGATKITLGSTLDDVIAIQGTPRSIQVGFGYTIFNYGSSDSISISSTTNRVISWKNNRGSLKVQMVPGSNTTGASKITIGSSLDDVVSIQGTPIVVQAFSNLTVFNYVMSDSISISNRTNQVVSWNNLGGSLKTDMLAGSNLSGATNIALGITLDDVIKIQGTPVSIQIINDVTLYYYGQSDCVSVSNTTNKVTSWKNPNGNLHL